MTAVDSTPRTSTSVAGSPGGPRRPARSRGVVLAVTVLTLVVGAAAVVLTRSGGGGASVFRSPLEDRAPLASDTSRTAASIAAQARYTPETRPVAGWYPAGFNSVIKMDEYSVPVYTVPADHPTTRVTWVDDERRPHPPGAGAGLQETWEDVPVPQGVDQLQADGTDGHLAIWQPATDTMWEFWTFRAAGPGGTGPYTAGYGARIDGYSRSTGVLPNDWGARATSLELVGGVMRMSDYVDGAFPYALAVGLPVLAEGFVPPATRGDGGVSETPSGSMEHAVLEGARFRLPADFDCSREALGPDATALLAMICTAARDYGLVVVDKTGGSVHLYAEDDRTVGTPYQELAESPWEGEVEQEFAGPGAVLQHFPWEALQQVEPSVPTAQD